MKNITLTKDIDLTPVGASLKFECKEDLSVGETVLIPKEKLGELPYESHNSKHPPVFSRDGRYTVLNKKGAVYFAEPENKSGNQASRIGKKIPAGTILKIV